MLDGVVVIVGGEIVEVEGRILLVGILWSGQGGAVGDIGK